MDFGILGPLEARSHGRRLALGGPKQRALLALLLLQAGRIVSSDQLIEELWPDRPAAAARRTLAVNISRLRAALAEGGDPILLTRPPGISVASRAGRARPAAVRAAVLPRSCSHRRCSA